VISAFSATPSAVVPGASSTLAWTVTGATTLSIDQGVGAVTGASASVSPVATTAYTLTATGAGGSATATATVTVGVGLPAGLAYATNPATYTRGVVIASNVPSSTGGAIVSWSVSPSLPAGLSLDAATGIVSGTPTAVAAVAVYVVTATNASGSATVNLSIAIAEPTPSSLPGIALPSEVSALPTGSSTPGSLRGALIAAAAAPPADSDYEKARTFKYVSERSLNQFDILNTIFTAMAQTHYEDPAVLNKGAYSAMVAWEEKNDKNQDQKRLVKWVVESTRDSATDPNVVKAWFRMPMMNDQPYTIQAKVVIEEAPTQNLDGSYADYGIWRMDVKVLEAGMPFRFVASATRDAQGRAVVKMGQAEPGKGGTPLETRGILVKSAQSGSGRVIYPDWEGCNQPDCVPAQVPVAYVYDAANVTLQKGEGTAVTKSRHAFVDIVNRYGLYDATTGADVAKTRRFGFPFRAAGAGGEELFGYYGAWQGRHQVWGNGAQVPAGLLVQRADVPPDQAAPQFTVSPSFTGILVKRNYAPAALSDLEGLAVETWDNETTQITWDGSRWCTRPVMGTCNADSGIVPESTFLAWQNSETDTRRNVMINFWDMLQQRPVNLVYEIAGPGGPGFYEATQSPSTPHPVRTGTTPLAFASGAQLWVNVGGPIYISWSGTAWVRKTVASFDPQTWTATFLPGGDVDYALQPDREYYFNNGGTNYVVKMVGGVAEVKLEIQSVAHPWDAATFVPAGSVLTQQWCGNGNCSTYEFVTDAASAKFMKLVYRTVGEADAQPKDGQEPKVAGDVVTSGMWGLQAGEVQFNWDYPQQGQDFGGAQQFLVDAAGEYVRLDDPIRLDSVTLTNGGVSRPFMLQFDGNWMQGLPNVWDDLRKTGFQVDDTIKAKAFSVPTGTVIGPYVVKQLQISEYMALSSAPALDLSEARAIDLASIPAFVDHGMGAMPDPAPLKYSEGNPVVQ
jgi:hypothetical protein